MRQYGFLCTRACFSSFGSNLSGIEVTGRQDNERTQFALWFNAYDMTFLSCFINLNFKLTLLNFKLTFYYYFAQLDSGI